MWAMDQAEVIVSGVFTTHHFVQTVTEILGELTLSAFRMGGVFHAADGRELVVQRTSWWRGWHEMREGGIVLGTARLQGFWRRTMGIGFRGAMYELRPADFWSRGWRLFDDTGGIVVEVRPRGIFRRGAYLTVMKPVNVDLLTFVYYLVNVRWQEQSGAAGVAAAGS
jgi:hypothetical protein